jgi:sterol 3beta-glucosyltransferase
MRITMAALGTRGDVQPMIALGKGLQAAGHTIRVIAGENFANWVQSYGFEFIGTVDMEALMTSENGVAWSQGSDNPRQQLRHMKNLLNEYGEGMVQSVYRSCQDADLLMSGFVSDSLVQAMSEKYGIPQISAMLQPYRPTRSGAASMVPIIKRGSSILNLWFGYFIERQLWSVSSDITNHLRTDLLGLPAHNASSYARALHRIPAIQGFSRYVVPPAADWDDHMYTTGYWFLDEDWQPSADLLRFLENGPAPVYLGFGSMSTRKPEETLHMAVEALQRSGQRGVFARGWSGIEASHLPDTVFMLDKAPHSWLFPRMAGVVHHGGAGTTAAGLHAVVPAFIVPHMSDQPYWARRVYELGVGVKPVERPKLTTDKLAEGIRALTTDARMKQAAAQLGEKIRQEDGVENAVQAVERILKRKVSSP